MVASALQHPDERTQSLCPECNRVVAAVRFERQGDIYLRARCPEHGSRESLYYRDASLYRAMSRHVPQAQRCHRLDCARGRVCPHRLERTLNILVDVTLRCDLQCPVCFASAGPAARWQEPTVDEILQRLPPSRGRHRPNVVLIGGEPTLRPDLPTLIRAIRHSGHVPRLATNGLRMADPAYVRRLAEAGLHWVVLQFDGVEPRASARMRGRSLVEEKRRTLANCTAQGLAVQLAVMVDERANTDQLGPILDFAFAEPAVKWVNFYPRTPVGRGAQDDDPGVHIADLFDLLARQTHGALQAEDFLHMVWLFKWLNRITGEEIFRPKLSTYPMVVVRQGDRLTPVTRLLRPWRGGVSLGALRPLLFGLPNILDYQRLRMPPEVLFITVEKFHSRFPVDLEEASDCHMAFMTRHGFVPFDIYNLLWRERAWSTDSVASG
jgi:uncharacterized radical SAM superfamily Fe-S cluster-containing enzyme